MNTKLAITLASVLLILTTGCLGGAGAPPEDTGPSKTAVSDNVYRVVFHDDQVVCYVYSDTGIDEAEGGISCLPFEEVNGYGG